MKWFLRDVRNLLLDWAVPALVALLFLGGWVVVGTILSKKVKQVVTDIHTIAESVEKSD